jgi:hypothetical protein
VLGHGCLRFVRHSADGTFLFIRPVIWLGRSLLAADFLLCSIPVPNFHQASHERGIRCEVSAERLSALLTGLSCPQDPDAFSIACREPGLVRIECIARRDGCRHMLRVDPDQPCNRITYSAQKVSGLFWKYFYPTFDLSRSY